jgi:hypothetical protein
MLPWQVDAARQVTGESAADGASATGPVRLFNGSDESAAHRSWDRSQKACQAFRFGLWVAATG